MPNPGERRVVAVGGGHGLSRVLEALVRLSVAPVAVVTVADDGGSSGRLRRDLGIIAPGDLRMALLSLARNRPLADALGHRFVRGELEGHALGNLMLVALAERHGGDFVAALDAAGALLDCVGRVLPATEEAVQLKARISGEEVGGQARVATAGGRVERVWLEPSEPTACRDAVEAILAAETLVLGPGSLFTSVIAGLLVPEVAEAVAACSAQVVYVANLTTQPGETSGFPASEHVQALLDHVPGLRLDAIVVHDGPAVRTGAGVPLEAARDPGLRAYRIVAGDVAARDPDGTPTGGHDPVRLAAVLRDLVMSVDR